MDEWLSFLDRVQNHLNKIDCDFPLFRGHNDKSWELIPSLYRALAPTEPEQLEGTLYQDFKSNCGPLYKTKLNSWEILLEMRHAGLSTRLLDWTENFVSALFFALRNVNWKSEDNELKPCIWILDPYKLNKKFFNKEEGISSVDDLNFSYDDLLEEDDTFSKSKITGPIIVLTPRSQQRIFAQKSVFSLHDGSFEPIEKMYKACIKRYDIPIHSIEKAQQFLFLSGTNEYSLFPDLDGLGRFLRDRHNIRY